MSTDANPPVSHPTDPATGFAWVVVGKIGRAHGIRGAVGVEPRTDAPDVRFAVGSRLRAGPPAIRELVVAEHRWHSGRLLVEFEGVADRTAAEAIRGSLLEALVDPAERPTDPEEFYDRALIGLRALDTAGEQVGTVAQVVHLPAHDLLAITSTDGHELLVPFISAMVPTVDIDSGFVVVDPPAGLFDSQMLGSEGATAEAEVPGPDAEE